MLTKKEEKGFGYYTKTFLNLMSSNAVSFVSCLWLKKTKISHIIYLFLLHSFGRFICLKKKIKKKDFYVAFLLTKLS